MGQGDAVLLRGGLNTASDLFGPEAWLIRAKPLSVWSRPRQVRPRFWRSGRATRTRSPPARAPNWCASWPRVAGDAVGPVARRAEITPKTCATRPRDRRCPLLPGLGHVPSGGERPVSPTLLRPTPELRAVFDLSRRSSRRPRRCPRAQRWRVADFLAPISPKHGERACRPGPMARARSPALKSFFRLPRPRPGDLVHERGLSPRCARRACHRRAAPAARRSGGGGLWTARRRRRARALGPCAIPPSVLLHGCGLRISKALGLIGQCDPGPESPHPRQGQQGAHCAGARGA